MKNRKKHIFSFDVESTSPHGNGCDAGGYIVILEQKNNLFGSNQFEAMEKLGIDCDDLEQIKEKAQREIDQYFDNLLVEGGCDE